MGFWGFGVLGFCNELQAGFLQCNCNLAMFLSSGWVATALFSFFRVCATSKFMSLGSLQEYPQGLKML